MALYHLKADENWVVAISKEDLPELAPLLEELGMEPLDEIPTILGEVCPYCGGLLSPSAAWANLPGAPGLAMRPPLGHRKGCPR